jgi:hypothetical protein
LGWISIPSLAFAVVIVLSDPNLVGSSSAIGTVALIFGFIGAIGLLAMLAAMVNSFRAIDAATQCGFVRSMITAVAVVAQALASCVIGLVLFPIIVGLLRLMVWSLRR